MKRLCIAIAMIFVFSAYAGGSWTNQETGVMELLSGEVRLNEIYSAAGIVVGPGCKLTVDGDVNAGPIFICRGGAVHITGKLTADVIYFDSAEGELKAEIGEVFAKYYTQCGGTVEIDGNIAARSNGDDDGRGIININSEFSVFNMTRLRVNGGIFARGGDVRAGSPPFGDEASRASFFAVRGIALRGYDLPVSGGGRTYIYSRKGLNATDGGAVYREYTQ